MIFHAAVAENKNSCERTHSPSAGKLTQMYKIEMQKIEIRKLQKIKCLARELSQSTGKFNNTKGHKKEWQVFRKAF